MGALKHRTEIYTAWECHTATFAVNTLGTIEFCGLGYEIPCPQESTSMLCNITVKYSIRTIMF